MEIPIHDSRVRVSRHSGEIDHIDVHRELALAIIYQFRDIVIDMSKRNFMEQMVIESVPHRITSYDRPIYQCYVYTIDFKNVFRDEYQNQTRPRGKLERHNGSRMPVLNVYPFAQAAVYSMYDRQDFAEWYMDQKTYSTKRCVNVVPVKDLYGGRKPGEVIAEEFFKLNPFMKASVLSLLAEFI